MYTNMYPEFMEAPFSELISRGADCIADIPQEDLLYGLRHTFLMAAKDLCVKTDSSWEDFVMGRIFSEAAEKIQEVIDVLGFE